MTEAYMEGFCKTAEEHGVDPHALLKYAGSVGNLLTGQATVRYGRINQAGAR